jgi:hypothetical protein
MPTFDWKTQGEHPSERFWIYWAATIPLTLLILIGWIFWWRFQKYYFAKEYLQVGSSVTTPTVTALVDYVTGGRVTLNWTGNVYPNSSSEASLDPEPPKRQRTLDSLFRIRTEKLSDDSNTEVA